VKWHLACGECSKGMELKSIGVLWTTDVCQVCGKTVPRHANGIPNGYPLTEAQLAQALARRLECEVDGCQCAAACETNGPDHAEGCPRHGF
jgi:hypothetical protein